MIITHVFNLIFINQNEYCHYHHKEVFKFLTSKSISTYKIVRHLHPLLTRSFALPLSLASAAASFNPS